jgi:hypothetical protein
MLTVALDIQPRFAFDLRTGGAASAAGAGSGGGCGDGRGGSGAGSSSSSSSSSSSAFVSDRFRQNIQLLNDETALYVVGRHFAVHHFKDETEFVGGGAVGGGGGGGAGSGGGGSAGDWLQQNMSFILREEHVHRHVKRYGPVFVDEQRSRRLTACVPVADAVQRYRCEAQRRCGRRYRQR